MFSEYCDTILAVVKRDVKVKETVIAKQKDFILNYFDEGEKKIFANLDSEQWNFVAQKVPSYYAEIIKFLERSCFTSSESSLGESIAMVDELEKTKSEEDKAEAMLTIRDKQYKVFLHSTFDIIEFSYNLITVYSLFDPSCLELIISQLMKLYIDYAKLNHDIVLEAKGYKLKSITPKEVSILCSNINIIKCLINIFQQSNEETGKQCTKVLEAVNNILDSAKSKFTEVYFPQTYIINNLE
jgi:hypothetical protein